MSVLEAAQQFAKQLEGAGVASEAAWKEALKRYPDASVAQEVEQLRRATVLEKDEQRVIWKMAIAIGFRVYWLSQPRETKQTPGVPDLWLAHGARQFCGWWETKRQHGGSRTAAQVEFAQECEAGNIPYGYGDRYHFAEWLKAHSFTPPSIPD